VASFSDLKSTEKNAEEPHLVLKNLQASGVAVYLVVHFYSCLGATCLSLDFCSTFYQEKVE
jgi:hypothetical protein